YAVTALRSSGVVTGDLHDLRISCAKTAIDWSGPSRISDIQLLNCSNGVRRVSVTNAPIHNLLATNVQYLFVGSGASVDVQHLTADRIGTLESFSGTPSTLTLTNSILANVTNLGTGSISADYVATNNTPAITISHWFAPNQPIFTNVIGGNYYLPTTSFLIDGGTTNVASKLCSEIALETTDPPIYIANSTISSTTFST